MASPLVVFFLLTIACAFFVEHSVVASEIRGLNPSKKSMYSNKKHFTCLDGSKTIPFTYVNDDYCDCQDGSDEPGTAACSMGRFHCPNVGHKAEDIFSSRVNDGICDCCDGSDEWDSRATCPNTCRELGEKAAEENRRRLELHEQGHRKRQEYVTLGREKIEEARSKLVEKEVELDALKEEVETLRAAKEAAEEPETKAKDEHKRIWEETKNERKEAKRREMATIGFDELDTNSDGLVSLEEIRARSELDDDNDGEVSEEEALEYLDNAQSVDFETFLSSAWDVISDKCKFRKYIPTPLPPDEAPDTRNKDEEKGDRGEDFDEDDDYDDEDDDDDFDDDDDVTPDDDEKMPEYDEATKELIAAADTARSALRDVENKKNNLEREVNDLKKFLDLDLGQDYEFAPLHDQCYEYTDREYTYKMCTFQKVTQKPKNGGGRETNLGTWGSWNGPAENRYSSMRYSDGEKCWNGPSRSATITVKCGLEDQLLSASEPNRCEYAMEFSSPAVCEPLKHVHEEL